MTTLQVHARQFAHALHSRVVTADCVHSFLVLAADPLHAFMAILHERCDRICPAVGVEERSTNVVACAAQHNGFDCGVWTLYALYTRVLKRAVQQQPEGLFHDMDLKTPSHALQFRCICPCPFSFLCYARITMCLCALFSPLHQKLLCCAHNTLSRSCEPTPRICATGQPTPSIFCYARISMC